MASQTSMWPASRRGASRIEVSKAPARWVACFLISCLFLNMGLWIPSSSSAQSNDRLVTVAKDTLYGGLIGLVLGGTLTLVVDEESRDDVVRWGVVIGVFGGFAFGVWEATRSDDLLGALQRPAGPPDGAPSVRAGGHGPLVLRLDPPLQRDLALSGRSLSGQVPPCLTARDDASPSGIRAATADPL